MYFVLRMAQELQAGNRKSVFAFIGKDSVDQCSCCNLAELVFLFIDTVRW